MWAVSGGSVNRRSSLPVWSRHVSDGEVPTRNSNGTDTQTRA